jgi:HEPN domain-containing protein
MSGRPEVDPEQWFVAAEWLERADDDLQAIQILVNAPSAPLRSAALHCQQAAEKIAKAALVAFGSPPPKTHDLDRLGKLVGLQHAELGEQISALAGLTAWYISARYPEAEITPSAKQILAVLNLLQNLRAQVQAFAPSDKA